MRKIWYSITIMIFSGAAFAEFITDQSFIGEWCGQWDESYPLCLRIDSVEANAKAKYKWVERAGGGFKKTQKQIRRINLNTLELENIIFVLDERNLNKANAVGLFRVQSRMAVLTKTNNEDPKVESEFESKFESKIESKIESKVESIEEPETLSEN